MNFSEEDFYNALVLVAYDYHLKGKRLDTGDGTMHFEVALKLKLNYRNLNRNDQQIIKNLISNRGNQTTPFSYRYLEYDTNKRQINITSSGIEYAKKLYTNWPKNK